MLATKVLPLLVPGALATRQCHLRGLWFVCGDPQPPPLEFWLQAGNNAGGLRIYIVSSVRM